MKLSRNSLRKATVTEGRNAGHLLGRSDGPRTWIFNKELTLCSSQCYIREVELNDDDHPSLWLYGAGGRLAADGILLRSGRVQRSRGRAARRKGRHVSQQR